MPGGVPKRKFQYCTPIVKKNDQLLSTEVRATQQKSRYQPKKRRYLYNIGLFSTFCTFASVAPIPGRRLNPFLAFLFFG